ncbi:MAG: TIGR03435 family protein, partial [Edaphobacter sp.]
MALDFEDSLKDRGFTTLSLDALLSLGRQWTADVFPEAALQQSQAQPSLLAGQYVMIAQGCLTFFDLARASILSLMFFLAVGFAGTTSHSRSINLQTSHKDHQAAYNGLDYRSHTEGKEDRELLPLRSQYLARGGAAGTSVGSVRQASLNSHGVPDHGWQAGIRGRGVHRENSEGAEAQRESWTAKHSSSTEPLLENHLWKSISFAAIVLLMMLLLRRNPRTVRKMILAAFGFLVIAVPMAFGIVRMIPLYGQILHASGPLPSFEVATIKPWKPTPRPPVLSSDGKTVGSKMPLKVDPVSGGERGQPTDRVDFIGQTQLLIASAYNLPPGHENQIVGAPDWVQQESNRYEIQAKIEDSLYAATQKMTPAQQREQVDLMEQSLLADRFKLKVHFETREMPVYALVVAKGGPKLTPAKDGESSKLFDTAESEHGIETTATAITLDQLVRSPLLFGG